MAISTRCRPSRRGRETEWMAHPVARPVVRWFIGVPSSRRSMTERTGGGYEGRLRGMELRFVEAYGMTTVALSSVIAFGSCTSAGPAAAASMT